jgi:hypothetical protein
VMSLALGKWVMRKLQWRRSKQMRGSKIEGIEVQFLTGHKAQR